MHWFSFIYKFIGESFMGLSNKMLIKPVLLINFLFFFFNTKLWNDVHTVAIDYLLIFIIFIIQITFQYLVKKHTHRLSCYSVKIPERKFRHKVKVELNIYIHVCVKLMYFLNI